MKKIRNSLPHVAVLLKSAYLTNRELLKGLLKYTRIEEPWTLTIKTGRADEPREIDFEAIRCAGIVADQPDEAILGYAHRRHIPVITILQDKQVSTDVVADVTCDNASVARLAADHLVATGFTHFAYVGERADAAWSRARYKAFRDALRERGVTDVADEPEGSARLADFLANLQKPCGLFVANDTRAVDVLRAAAEVDVSIPDEIGLVSVDNDDILCETSLPALSSIPWDTEKTGYEMARFLNEAIASSKRRQTFRTIYYRATAVVSRQSSAHILSSDALVR